MKKWTEEEIEYLKDNYRDTINKELVKKFGRKADYITKKANKLGLRKSEEILRLNDKYIKGYWKGKKMPYMTERNLNENPMRNSEAKEKMIKSLKEGYASGRIEKWQLGKTKDNCEGLKKISEKSIGRNFCEEWRNNIKKTHWTKKNKKEREIIIKNMTDHRDLDAIRPKISNSVKKLWKDENSVFNSPEYRKKISLATSMENNPMWKGGKSFEPYGIEFNKKIKNFVRKRDNQVCMNCGIHREKLNGALDCHHVNYDKNCNIEQNLISLCKRCHSMTNANREYWTNLFQSKLSKFYDYKYSEKNEIILEVGNEK